MEPKMVGQQCGNSVSNSLDWRSGKRDNSVFAPQQFLRCRRRQGLQFSVALGYGRAERRHIEGVVVAQPGLEAAGLEAEESRDGADDDRRPGFDEARGGRDRNQSRHGARRGTQFSKR